MLQMKPKNNNDGLPLSSSRPVPTQIITNYISVVVATSLESLWTLPKRILYVLPAL